MGALCTNFSIKNPEFLIFLVIPKLAFFFLCGRFLVLMQVVYFIAVLFLVVDVFCLGDVLYSSVKSSTAVAVPGIIEHLSELLDRVICPCRCGGNALHVPPGSCYGALVTGLGVLGEML